MPVNADQPTSFTDDLGGELVVKVAARVGDVRVRPLTLTQLCTPSRNTPLGCPVAVREIADGAHRPS
jgi:hypothetical protein